MNTRHTDTTYQFKSAGIWLLFGMSTELKKLHFEPAGMGSESHLESSLTDQEGSNT
jgi:hypothetical protein